MQAPPRASVCNVHGALGLSRDGPENRACTPEQRVATESREQVRRPWHAKGPRPLCPKPRPALAAVQVAAVPSGGLVSVPLVAPAAVRHRFDAQIELARDHLPLHAAASARDSVEARRRGRRPPARGMATRRCDGIAAERPRRGRGVAAERPRCAAHLRREEPPDRLWRLDAPQQPADLKRLGVELPLLCRAAVFGLCLGRRRPLVAAAPASHASHACTTRRTFWLRLRSGQ